MPKNKNNGKHSPQQGEKNETPTPATPSPVSSPIYLGLESSIKGEKKTDKIYFTDIRQNNKPGIYTNVMSRTPTNKPTLLAFGANKYINIEFNDMFRQFIYELIGRIDADSLEQVTDSYQIDSILNTYETQGFVKCKIDLERFNSSFFSQMGKERSNGQTIKPIENADFLYDRINKGVYTLKVTGFWRKESEVNGRLQTTHSGLTIKVLSVLVHNYTNSEAEDAAYEDELYKQLRADSIALSED